MRRYDAIMRRVLRALLPPDDYSSTDVMMMPPRCRRYALRLMHSAAAAPFYAPPRLRAADDAAGA